MQLYECQFGQIVQDQWVDVQADSKDIFLQEKELVNTWLQYFCIQYLNFTFILAMVCD